VSERTTISFRVDGSLSEALDAAADDLGTSKSELCREVLAEAVAEDLDVPDHLEILTQRERMKRRNRVEDLRGGFSGRVKKQLHRRYHKGDYTAEDIAAVAENYRREARLLWPEDDEARNEALATVDSLVEQYQRLDDAVDEQERTLDGGTNVEDLVEDAERLLSSQKRGDSAVDYSPVEVVQMLTARPNVDEADARAAVEEATDDALVDEALGGEADD
jgi:antitoxin component of RelBE/YafQ-DinJ toxin-antitoxin module